MLIEGIALDHVAIAVPRIAGVIDAVGGTMGGKRHLAGPGQGFVFAQWAYRRGELVEVIEPEGKPGGFMHRFLEAHGAGVHHITFKVGDIQAARTRAQEYGYEVVGYDDSNAGWQEMFLHPKQAGGIVVQLARSVPELDVNLWEDKWPFPEPSKAAVGGPVELRTLVLAAGSAETAKRQWGGLLGGQPAGDDRTPVYAWDGSPMQVKIDTSSALAPGPVALEVTGLSGPAAREASEVLGIELRPVSAA